MTHGLDSNALTSHQTATAVNQVMTAAQGKILLIARNYAETGVKELFYELYELVRENQTKPDVFPINGQFAVVHPSTWIDRYDMRVTVGIGNGSKDQQLMHLQGVAQMLQMVGSTEYGYLITAENVYNLASEFIKNSGYFPDKYISHPSQVEPPPPPPNPDLIRAQADAGLKGAQAQKTQMETQLEPAQFDWQKKVDATEATLEATQDRPVGLQRGK
jgi:hypothetical protein